MTEDFSDGYEDFLSDLEDRIRAAQVKAGHAQPDEAHCASALEHKRDTTKLDLLLVRRAIGYSYTLNTECQYKKAIYV